MKINQRQFLFRLRVVGIILLLMTMGLLVRMVQLTVFNRAFLQKQGNMRMLRTVTVPAYRGMITDRNGEPLAVSTPVKSVWMNPKEIDLTETKLSELAVLLEIDKASLLAKLKQAKTREFVYLRRHISPLFADKIQRLAIKGLYFVDEYKRYYPQGEIAAHVVGFTNIDDVGQEGFELAYNRWLEGRPGKKRVLKDRLGHIISEVADLQEPHLGKDLALSIDKRLQFIAYAELKAALARYQARSAAMVVLDVKTNEVLAMVNQPSFNPNAKYTHHDDRFRNRAVTDVFEPGSTLKAFSMAAALQSGQYQPDSAVDTSPGFVKVGNKVIRDATDNGVMTITRILQRSSNVGISKIILTLAPDDLFLLLERLGFGRTTNSGFPGESAGTLLTRQAYRNPIELASLSFGYGVSVTALQLAAFYAVIANNGIKYPVSLLKQSSKPIGVRILEPHFASQLLHMLESVIEKGGTAFRAAIPGYRVAGKTGTVWMIGPNGYMKDKHTALFVGMVPASKPRFVAVVVINEPGGRKFYGGQVAAPIFSRVMSSVLRLYDIAPDKLSQQSTRTI